MTQISITEGMTFEALFIAVGEANAAIHVEAVKAAPLSVDAGRSFARSVDLVANVTRGFPAWRNALYEELLAAKAIPESYEFTVSVPSGEYDLPVLAGGLLEQVAQGNAGVVGKGGNGARMTLASCDLVNALAELAGA